MNKVIGIVGGMGPQAGIALYQSLLKHTKATTDQQHLPVVLMSFPQDIVDRTLFIEGKISTNPAYAISKIIQSLVVTGAQVIGIACNTSHSRTIFDVITSEVEKIPAPPKLLNMPLEVCKYISQNLPGVRRVGLMTTNGIYQCQLYKRMLEERGYEVIIPETGFQNEVIHKMIYDPAIGIKANPTFVTEQAKRLYRKAIKFFKASNADAIVMGCTELSQVSDCANLSDIHIIDSTECLAGALVREAVD